MEKRTAGISGSMRFVWLAQGERFWLFQMLKRSSGGRMSQDTRLAPGEKQPKNGVGKNGQMRGISTW